MKKLVITYEFVEDGVEKEFVTDNKFSNTHVVADSYMANVIVEMAETNAYDIKNGYINLEDCSEMYITGHFADTE